MNIRRLGLAFALLPAFVFAGPIGYTVNFLGQFGTIDLGTGTFTPIGDGLPNTPDGLGGRPGGPFYTVDSATGHLLRIRGDGSWTDVGDTGTGPNVGPEGISLMGSLRSGALYGLDFSNNVYRLNSHDGSATNLGPVSGLPPVDFGYMGNMMTSLNGNETTLFYTLIVLSGPNQIEQTLFSINLQTLTATGIPLSGVQRLIGSGWIGGTYYGFSEFGEIVKINPSTGVANVVAHYDSGKVGDGPPFTGLFGVVETPEPASMLLTGAGLLAVSFLRRRRR